jgi:phosphopentomutase
MTGVPVLFDWTYYPDTENCFPQEFMDELMERTGVPGFLGCSHASGTDILRELGEEHIRTGKPICYTSADSVFQVAAHEGAFGLERLYEFCETARAILMEDNVGRVIARPFVGDKADDFVRTGNRRDYSIEPPALTLLDHLVAEGKKVCGIGKISDIFAHRGISQSTKATGLEALLDETIRHIENEADDSLIFTNLVNFDQDFGHRRDPDGYADALIYFDQRLPDVQRAMGPEDLLFITSDHGCDPTWEGTEHTREYVPLLAWRHNMPRLNLGIRSSFADLGQTIAEVFNIPRLDYGESFLAELNAAD